MPDDSHPSKKPKIGPSSESSDLLSRLNSFLPQLEAANAILDPSQNMEEVDEDDEAAYIEMNLGLGVLKEIRPGEDEVSSGEDETDDKEANDALEELLKSSKRHGKGPRGQPSIEEVKETASTPTPHYSNKDGENLLEDVLNASKQGKPLRGKPLIEEVEDASLTPTLE